MNQEHIDDRILYGNERDDVAGSYNRVEPARKRLKTAGLWLLGIAVVVAAGYAGNRYESIQNFLSKPAVAETNGADEARAETPFFQHAKKADLKSCSRIFPALGELLTSGSKYSVQSFWDSEDADKHAVQALVGMDYATKGYTGSAAGVVFAAPTASACEGAMIRVAPFSTSCSNIPSMLPQGSQLANTLGRVSVYSLGDNGGDALLLPTGDTCIVISVASAGAVANAQ